MNVRESGVSTSFRLLSVAALCAAAASTARAQDTPAAESAQTLSVVTVTATKRSEDIQKVPIAISAFSGKELEDVGAHDTYALQDQTPALRIESASGRALPRFNLRGVGSDEFSPNANSSVGIYMDEVFLNNTVGQGFPLFDLDRVEVLRGPQGTLWGKNTTAGAVSFVSRRPTEDTGGYANLTFGSFGEKDLEGAFGGALNDKLLARASILYSQRDAFVRDTYLGQKVGDYSEAAGRVQLLWKITEEGSLLLNAHQAHIDNNIAIYHTGELAGGKDSKGYGTNPSPWETTQDEPNEGIVNTSGGSAKLDWGLPADWRLTNILAVEDNDFVQTFDDDGTPATAAVEDTTSRAEQLSEEFRITSPDSGRIGWIFGAYAFYERLRDVYSQPTNKISVDGKFVTHNYALFANSTIHLADTWTARLGLRETREQKSVNQEGTTYTPSPTQPANPGASLTPLVNAFSYLRNNTWSQLTWDATLDHNFTDSVMSYVRVAKGFRGGNYNGGVGSAADLSTVGPETLTDYELGLKSSWMDRRIVLNADVFRYDYRDLQVFILLGNGARLENAAKARINGAELELALSPVDSILFKLSGAFIDSKYLDFSNASVPPALNNSQPANLDGQRIERSPRETASALLQYFIPVGSGKLTLQTDWRYTGDVPFASWVNSPNLHPTAAVAGILPTIFQQTEQGAVTTGNARIAYTDASGNFTLSLWAKNVTDKRYKTNLYNLLFNRSTGYYLNDPLTFGATVSLNFGK